VITRVLTDEAGQTGVYCDENGKPMAASTPVRDPAFASRIVAETRALLATIPVDGSRRAAAAGLAGGVRRSGIGAFSMIMEDLLLYRVVNPSRS